MAVLLCKSAFPLLKRFFLSARQIILLFTCISYILIDTIQIPGIAGTLHAVTFWTNTFYVRSRFQTEEIEELGLADLLDESKEDESTILSLAKGMQLQMLRSFDYNMMDVEDSTILDNEASLPFVRTHEQLLDWLDFTLENLFQKANEDEMRRFMMNSNYHMGSRLMVNEGLRLAPSA